MTEPLFEVVETWTHAMVTAHRQLPKGADGWLRLVLRERLAKLRDVYGTEDTTSGMAIGGDTIFAEETLDLGFPLTAAIPFPGQPFDQYGPKWTKAQQQCWLELRERASHVEYVSPVDPVSYRQRTEMLHERNTWMLERNEVILAIWDPANTRGGTYSCIRKAVSAGKPVILFNLAARTVTKPSPAAWAKYGIPLPRAAAWR